MLRYLIKTLLQMNLFTDTLRDASNSSEALFNLSSVPPFNTTRLLDWGNFTADFNAGSQADTETGSYRCAEFPRLR
ncbi:hypothetical protein DPEC_G00223560 [Dallia pectoralis]|uniref:Uncharacterized protein n=1 Tax=Dallia pectoralis TaxID=75939 RepID=A0ACC2FZN0_DALPE|nr:hypothetical protein DPEC_G00223560 [Dallia pectoralis]